MDQITNESVKKVKFRHPDRVTLTPDLLAKLDGWMKQVTDTHRGVRLSRNNMVDWLIGSYPAELPSADIKIIAERFYDEERFLKDAIRELRSKKSRGESVDLAELLASVGSQKPKPPRKPRKLKVAAEPQATANSPEATV
jgi:hypothetical protein